MMFRKLYWVTEKVNADNTHHFMGVFTSIPNLLRQGLSSDLDLDEVRLSLTKLDCKDGVIASWLGPEYDTLDSDLKAFIKTEEFTSEQCDTLGQRIHELRKSVVRK